MKSSGCELVKVTVNYDVYQILFLKSASSYQSSIYR